MKLKKRKNKSAILAVLLFATLASGIAHSGTKKRGAPGAVCQGVTLADRVYLQYPSGSVKNTKSSPVNVVCQISLIDYAFWSKLLIWVDSPSGGQVKCYAVQQWYDDNDPIPWYMTSPLKSRRSKGKLEWSPLFGIRRHYPKTYVKCELPANGEINHITWIEDR
jgi:hypothetical protein